MPKTVERKKKQVYIANESFVANIKGIDQAFHQGRSRAQEGDEVVVKYPHLFDLLEDHDAPLV